jgi:hypothetical protein
MTKDEIMAITAPEGTKTWNPVSHREVIEAITTVVEAEGIGVRDETYSVKNGGRNMFGTWTLDIPLGDGGSLVQLGFRNSIMKTFAVGMCSGTHVLVCSNMMFSGEYMEFRKHTSGLDFDELLIKANAALGQTIARATSLQEWHDGLRDTPLDQVGLKTLTFDAMESGILAPNHFKGFLTAWEEERETYGEETLHQFHGAVTRINRPINLFTVADRTAKLNAMCDAWRQAA